MPACYVMVTQKKKYKKGNVSKTTGQRYIVPKTINPILHNLPRSTPYLRFLARICLPIPILADISNPFLSKCRCRQVEFSARNNCLLTGEFEVWCCVCKFIITLFCAVSRVLHLFAVSIKSQNPRHTFCSDVAGANTATSRVRRECYFLLRQALPQ